MMKTIDVWTSIEPIFSGQSVQLTLKVMAGNTDPYSTTAEIIQQYSNDPDSIPNNKDTEPLEDDTAILAIGPQPTFTISGRVILDNGLGSGIAYNGILDGDELGLGAVEVSLLLAQNESTIARTSTSGDGSYLFSYDQSHAGQPLIIRTVSQKGNFQISENPGAIPALVNPSASDGELTFTPATATDYENILFGQVSKPALLANQNVTVRPGGAVSIPHKYTASGPGTLTFSLQNFTPSSDGIFTTGLYSDLNCTGSIDIGDVALISSISVVAEQEVCVIGRHTAAVNAPVNSTLSYNLVSNTVFSGLSLNYDLDNNDRVTISNDGNAGLFKGVCNLSSSACDVATGSGFGSENDGLPGDIIQYRLVFKTTGSDPVEELDIQDSTPHFYHSKSYFRSLR